MSAEKDAPGVLSIMADLKALGVPGDVLRPIEDWERERQRMARFKCKTCRDTGWVPSGCECHDDPCPACRPLQRVTPPAVGDDT